MGNCKCEKTLESIKRAKAIKIEIKRITDEDPDLSFLETIPEGHYGVDGSSWVHVTDEDKQEIINKYGSIWNACVEYAKQDKKRLDDYNRGTWEMIGIKAVATIHIPICDNTVKIQTIDSGGLFGIASDSDNSDIKDAEICQIEEVKRCLRILCIDDVDNCEIVTG